MEKLEYESSTMNAIKRAAFVTMGNSSKYKFTLWGALTERAQILDSPI